jgi:hypothetical protein
VNELIRLTCELFPVVGGTNEEVLDDASEASDFLGESLALQDESPTLVFEGTSWHHARTLTSCQRQPM